MVMEAVGEPLVERSLPDPVAAAGQVLIEVSCCGICRTDLHVVDGELSEPAALPLIPGHQIVGRVLELGPGVSGLQPGQRVGVPWVAWTCGECKQCRAGRENLCRRALFTGYTRDGGYAERTVADAHYCFPLGERPSDTQAAPLLCAGLIGYRALRMTAEPECLGLYGFGSSAHLIAQIALHQGRRVFAFTRDGDRTTQEFARRLGAEWAGGSSELPPQPLDAAIIFAPVGELVPAALRAGIHMSEIPAFPYELLWQERQLRSVANLTRADGEELLPLAAEAGVEAEVTTYPLADANRALGELRSGALEGSGVLVVAS
jgi:propanol-preferring alcohol dehydrogenase